MPFYRVVWSQWAADTKWCTATEQQWRARECGAGGWQCPREESFSLTQRCPNNSVQANSWMTALQRDERNKPTQGRKEKLLCDAVVLDSRSSKTRFNLHTFLSQSDVRIGRILTASNYGTFVKQKNVYLMKAVPDVPRHKSNKIDPSKWSQLQKSNVSKHTQMFHSV